MKNSKQKITVPPNATYSHYSSKMSFKNRVPNSERKSRPILTKYEYTKLIGFRAQQLAQGVPSRLDDNKGMTDPFDIAKEEVHQKVVPFLIRRAYEYDG